jgi:hypothetical protein
MNNLGLRPSAILKKAQPSDSRRIRKSAKVLGVTLGILFALCAAVGICLVAFSAFKARTSAPKESADVSGPPAVKASPGLPAISATPGAQQYKGVVISQPASQDRSETVPADHSTIDQTSTPALSPIPTPVGVPIVQNDRKASGNDQDFLESKVPAADAKNSDKQLSGAERKSLEKARREAERKRSRLEEMYQKHEISSEAYKKGEEEYKGAIEKYRNAVNAGR